MEVTLLRPDFHSFIIQTTRHTTREIKIFFVNYIECIIREGVTEKGLPAPHL